MGSIIKAIRCTHRQSERYASRVINRQTDGQTDRRTDRERERETIADLQVVQNDVLHILSVHGIFHRFYYLL